MYAVCVLIQLGSAPDMLFLQLAIKFVCLKFAWSLVGCVAAQGPSLFVRLDVQARAARNVFLCLMVHLLLRIQSCTGTSGQAWHALLDSGACACGAPSFSPVGFLKDGVRHASFCRMQLFSWARRLRPVGMLHLCFSDFYRPLWIALCSTFYDSCVSWCNFRALRVAVNAHSNGRGLLQLSGASKHYCCTVLRDRYGFSRAVRTSRL